MVQHRGFFNRESAQQGFPKGGFETMTSHAPSWMTAKETNAAQLIARYEVLLFDAYGVLVRSDGVVDGATQLLKELVRIQHPFFVLTNDASRSIKSSSARYRSLGLPVDEHRIITSGSLLTRFVQEHALDGARAMVMGSPDSLLYAQNAGLDVIGCDEHARDVHVFVVGDLAQEGVRLELGAMLSSILRAFDSGATPILVLPNPDTFYPRGHDTFGVTAGAAAAAFEQILNERYPGHPNTSFVRLGKPHPYIFEEGALRARVHKSAMVMIGDQLATDVRGALDFGIDAALVTTGIITDTHLKDATEPLPTWILRSLHLG